MAYVGFKNLKNKLKESGKSDEEAGAIAATIGRNKYGKKKFQTAAAKGKKMKGMKKKSNGTNKKNNKRKKR